MSYNISVIIPAYNAERFLSKAITSSLNQTYKPKEIIIVNDGSTDGTEEVIKSFKDVSIIHKTQDNGGDGSARNAGIKEASGEFIAFLDADDYWEEEFLEKTFNFLEVNPECIAVSCGHCTKKKDASDFIWPKIIAEGALTEPQVLESFFDFWDEHDHLVTGSVLIRTEAIRRAGFQNTEVSVAADTEYWTTLGFMGKWGVIPDVLWVGTSELHAKDIGVAANFKKRRENLPTVEQWEVRLRKWAGTPNEANYIRVRAKVASELLYGHTVTSNYFEVKRTLKKYGSGMRQTRMTKLIKKAAVFGSPGLWILTILFKVRESIK